jgi:UDP-N-acetylmuramate--alanine ligase
MEFSSKTICMVGIKGTGMASLAVLLSEAGAVVYGCDTAERFSTDRLLEDNRISVTASFEATVLRPGTDLVVYSSAYRLDLPVLAKAIEEKIGLHSYPEFLSALTGDTDSYAVAGTHGKTTTTAVAGYLLSSLGNHDFPFMAIYGSNLQGTESLPFQGTDCVLLEACEYRDHFLSYRLRGALVTNIEYDHPDYFEDLEQVNRSFEQFATNLEPNGFLVCCSDNQGSRRLARYCRDRRPDLTVMTYGFDDPGPFRIKRNHWEGTYTLSCLDGVPFDLPAAAEPMLDDYVGGAILAMAIMLDRPVVRLYLDESKIVSDEAVFSVLGMLTSRLSSFPGCVGRAEVLLEEGGVTYIDDYAHHPSEIAATIELLHLRYPGRPVAILFCPHTASRTKALRDGFVSALALADKVMVQHSYASARNDADMGEDPAALLGRELSAYTMKRYRTRLQAVSYAPDDETAVSCFSRWLQPGDLCITMGAGNNRFLGPRIAQARRSL